MKYIIPEKRIERLANKYLSSLGLTEGNYDEDGFDIIQGVNHMLAYRSEEEKLYMNIYLIKDLRDLFDLTQRESMTYIKNWFQDAYETDVKSVWLLFPDEPFTY